MLGRKAAGHALPLARSGIAAPRRPDLRHRSAPALARPARRPILAARTPRHRLSIARWQLFGQPHRRAERGEGTEGDPTPQSSSSQIRLHLWLAARYPAVRRATGNGAWLRIVDQSASPVACASAQAEPNRRSPQPAALAARTQTHCAAPPRPKGLRLRRLARVIAARPRLGRSERQPCWQRDFPTTAPARPSMQ
jgi:hypothetical protein